MPRKLQPVKGVAAERRKGKCLLFCRQAECQYQNVLSLQMVHGKSGRTDYQVQQSNLSIIWNNYKLLNDTMCRSSIVILGVEKLCVCSKMRNMAI
jgi:hypothetical protein